MKPSPKEYTPSYKDLLVEFHPGEFRSGLKTLKAFDAEELIAPLEHLTKGPRAYTSVQCGPGPEDHVELNSDLVYVNHSCEPNVAFDLSSPDPHQWHVRALKPLEVGSNLTFFYPSTEWEMDQPFDCECGTASCLGRIQGARYLSRQQLDARGFVNPWIIDMLRQKQDPARN